MSATACIDILDVAAACDRGAENATLREIPISSIKPGALQERKTLTWYG